MKSTLAYLLRTVTLNKGVRESKSQIKCANKGKKTHKRKHTVAHLKVNKKHIKCLSNKPLAEDEFLVSKETVVVCRWERSKQKFGFIKRVDKG